MAAAITAGAKRRQLDPRCSSRRLGLQQWLAAAARVHGADARHTPPVHPSTPAAWCRLRRSSSRPLAAASARGSPSTRCWARPLSWRGWGPTRTAASSQSRCALGRVSMSCVGGSRLPIVLAGSSGDQLEGLGPNKGGRLLSEQVRGVAGCAVTSHGMLRAAGRQLHAAVQRRVERAAVYSGCSTRTVAVQQLKTRLAFNQLLRRPSAASATPELDLQPPAATSPLLAPAHTLPLP